MTWQTFGLAVSLLLVTPSSAQTTGDLLKFPGSAYSPHAAWGGGWSTTIYIAAYQGSATVTIGFYGKDARKVLVPLTTSNGLTGTVDELSLTVQTGDVESIEIQSTSAIVSTGWVVISSTSNTTLHISEIFRASVPGRPDFEASIPFMRTTGGDNVRRHFTYDHRSNTNTGVAVLRGEVDPARAQIACFEDGNSIGTAPIPWGPQEVYGAWQLTSLVPGTLGKMGYCSIQYLNTQPNYFLNVVAFRFRPDGAFTTVPVSYRNFD